MNKKGYTTESGGRQNGFALEPEIDVISKGESNKSLLIFTFLLVTLSALTFYFLKTPQ